MIEHLNNTVWAKIGVSKIHGVGVIAIRDIPGGQKIYPGRSNQWLECDDYRGLHPAILELIKQRWPLAFEGGHFYSPNDDAHLPSFLNHSKNPNVDRNTFRALRDIKEGEELTEDYGPYAPVDN
jgi:SET domain-containing protein